MGNMYMEAAQINYRGGEKKMSVEEALKTTSGEAAAIAQLQQDVSDLNTEKANKSDIATEFSDLTNYNAGDLVYYEGALYEFQVDHTAGVWETSEVIQKDLSDIVTTLKSGLTNLVKVYHANGTTDSVGDFIFSLPSGGTLLSVRPLRDAEYYSSWWGVTIASTHNNVGYSAKAIKDDGTPLASQAIKFDVYYI